MSNADGSNGDARLSIAVTEGRNADRPRWGLRLGSSLGALLLLWLILLRVNATDLFFDEAQYWTWSLEPAFGYYSKPPLIAWVIGLATETCGASEFCIRLPSPLLHTATAFAVFALGAQLYDARVGFWSALAFATLPGISLSSGIISTDAPLLLFWALALCGLIGLLKTSRIWPGVLLGIALGLGLNAKYAMAFFIPCLALYLALTQEHRRLLKDGRLLAALLFGATLIAPNLAWNAANGFATIAHTASNADWGASLFNPRNALEFLGAQFGVFGPILFSALIAITVRAWKRGVPAEDRFLLFFALPVLAIVTVQAFLSHANANWAAVAYVSATTLVMATLIRDLSWRWLRASFGVHLTVLATLGLGVAFAGQLTLPFAGDFLARSLGWREVALVTHAVLEDGRRRGSPYSSIVTVERALTAELLYYLRDDPTPVLAWRGGDPPQNHYQLKRPFVKGTAEPALLVALRPDLDGVLTQFARVEPLGTREIPAGAGKARRITFYRLAGFKVD